MSREYKPMYTIELGGRPCRVSLSTRARDELLRHPQSLYVQMELYFSCLLRLKVRFFDSAPAGENIALVDDVYVSFRPIMTAHCSNDEIDTEPPVTDFPIRRDSPFIPHWLNIDFRRRQWMGEFGYTDRS